VIYNLKGFQNLLGLFESLFVEVNIIPNRFSKPVRIREKQ